MFLIATMLVVGCSRTPTATDQPTVLAVAPGGAATAGLSLPTAGSPPPTKLPQASPAPSPPAQITAPPALAEQTTITGTVAIQTQRPVPPNATLTVQLRKWDRDGIGVLSVIDEQAIEPRIAEPLPYTLTYDPTAIQPATEYLSYEVAAELRAPGRLPWVAVATIDPQRPPANVAIVLQPPEIAAISGTITIPALPVLPSDAQLIARLLPAAGFGASGIGELMITPVTPGPVPFTLEYPPASIMPEQSYTLHAEVRAGAKLLLSIAAAPVITQGHPSTVEANLTVPATVAAVTGTVTYLGQAALPPGAVLTLRLEDVSMADAPARLLATQTISPVESGPITFAIEYDPTIIDQRGSYVISAAIISRENSLFAGPDGYAVIDHDAPTRVEIILK
jgi:uncharacterized lipoprotein YbaY